MSSIKRLVVPVIITITIVRLLSSVKSEDVHEEEQLCNSKAIANDSPQERDISFLSSVLIEATPTHDYSQHIDLKGYHGVAACNGQISREDCYDCLDFASKAIFKSCGFVDGWQIKLVDCRLRIEHYEIADW